MDKELIAFIIAKNGLDTAQLTLTIKAAGLSKAADVELDASKRKKMLASQAKLVKLVKSLAAAEAGLEAYLKDPV